MKTEEFKVLHIISSLGIGGAERQLLEILRANKSHGVCQLMIRESWNENLLKDSNRVFNLGMKKGIPDPRIFLNLKRILEFFKPEIIHTWMYHASLLEVVLRKFGYKRNIPLVWGIRCSNMNTKYYNIQLKMVIKACKYFSRTPDVLISNSIEGKNIHKDLGFNNDNFKTIVNGINTDKFKPNNLCRNSFRGRWNINSTTKIFLCVGRVDPMKDHATLLKAFSEIRKNFKNILLLLAGKNTDLYKDIECVLTLGEYKKIEEIYPAADFIISSSAFGEGFSNALAEGMSSGLIPISTKVGDAENIMGEIGVLINPKDAECLKKAINKMIVMEGLELKEQKQKARDRIISKFSLSKMLASYNKIYFQLTDR